MTNLRKLALIAAVATAGVASPVFAQSFDPDLGTGNATAFSAGPAVERVAAVQHRIAPRRTHRRAVAASPSGLNAFAMVPAFQGGSAFDASLTGGGSSGYNENLRRDDW